MEITASVFLYHLDESNVCGKVLYVVISSAQ